MKALGVAVVAAVLAAGCCVTYPGVAKPRCMSVDPCEIVTCPPGGTCMITLTSPGNVACL